MSDTTLNFVLSLTSGKILATNIRNGVTVELDYAGDVPAYTIPPGVIPPVRNELVKPRRNYSASVININAHKGPDEV
jgi:hypothetical protein